MRSPIPTGCDDVMQALAAPGVLSSEAVAEHLAGCPSCAAWAERDAALTRLWEATRPIEPSPVVWDAVWTRLADRLDTVPEPEQVPNIHVMPIRSRPGMRVRLFIAAQAAAVLAALVLGLSHSRPTHGPRPLSVDSGGPAQTASLIPVEMEPGLLGLLREREDGLGFRLVEIARDDRSNALAGDFDALNHFEAMAE